jgi:zinc transporter ZupT
MIAAVAGELFPLVLDNNPDIDGDTRDVRSLGVLIGFSVGFTLIHGVEWIISSYEEEADVEAATKNIIMESTTNPTISSSRSSVDGADSPEKPPAPSEDEILPTDELVTASPGGSRSKEPMDKSRYEGKFEPEPVRQSQQAIQKQSHREHITVHLRELMDSITIMRVNTDKLLLTRGTPTPGHTPGHTPGAGGDLEGGPRSRGGSPAASAPSSPRRKKSGDAAALGHMHVGGDHTHAHTHNALHHHHHHQHSQDGGLRYVRHEEAEELAEIIDEEIHKLQYKLDHCRRLLQGSECGVFHGPSWLNSEKLEGVKGHISELGESVEHLLEHMAAGQFDVHVLQEIYTHMDDMDNQLITFHEAISEHADKWRRHKFPEVVTGEAIPAGLVIPVCIDSFIDGFLIGITVAVSYKAGLILAMANCLEMGFLGMAYTSRVMKCTGSSVNARIATIVSAPLIMLAAAGLGGEIGLMSESNPLAFVSFVSFGIIAILFLVCNELLIEAKELQGDDPKWWINGTIFLGIYIVILMDHYI